MEKEEKLGEALLKVALGYQVAEVTEEYAEVDGELKLTKRKRTKKDVPPDLKAVQMLLERGGNRAIEGLSDQELEEEKLRLLSLLKAEDAIEEKSKGVAKNTAKAQGQVCVEKKNATDTTQRKTRAKPRKRVVRKTKTAV